MFTKISLTTVCCARIKSVRQEETLKTILNDGKIVTYYFRYNHEFASHKWEDRQKHLAALFAEDSNIVFGKATPLRSSRKMRMRFPSSKEMSDDEIRCKVEGMIAGREEGWRKE